MRRLPTDPAALRAYLSSLEVEHGFVHPDEIPGYWDDKRRERERSVA